MLKIFGWNFSIIVLVLSLISVVRFPVPIFIKIFLLLVLIGLIIYCAYQLKDAFNKRKSIGSIKELLEMEKQEKEK